MTEGLALRSINKLRRLWLSLAARAVHRRNCAHSSGRPSKVLFVCFGNICRSPLAEVLARNLLEKIQVTSAGFNETEDRSTPPNVLLAAQEIGIDLSQHLSRCITSPLIEKSDLVVLLDVDNYACFCAKFPAYICKVVFLGMFMKEGRTPSIPDPYGANLEETRRVVKMIQSGIAGLEESIRTR